MPTNRSVNAESDRVLAEGDATATAVAAALIETRETNWRRFTVAPCLKLAARPVHHDLTPLTQPAAIGLNRLALERRHGADH